MPRIPFDQSNKVQSTNFDFPKLKLKNGQRARILLLEDPIMEYRHSLDKPKVENGTPKMGTFKRKDGTEYQDYEKQFISTPLCTGDFDVLRERGSDPANCLMCKMAHEHPDWVKAPQARYAMHVINYKIKPGESFETNTPFAVETLVWAFSQTMFNRIVDFKTEWTDLRQHDLLLGPCTNEGFQKFEITVGAKAAWLESEDRKRLTLETFEGQKIPDLSIACGSKKEERWIRIDLDAIAEAWAVVNGSGLTPGPTGRVEDSSTSLTDDLATLLDTPAAEAPAAAPASTEDLDALLGEAKEEKPAPAAEAKKEDPAPAESFDDLLAGL